MTFSYNITENSIVVVDNTTFKSLNANKDNSNFQAIIDALKDETTTFDDLVDLFSPAAAVASATEDYTNIEVRDGVLLYKEIPVAGALADRILQIVREGLPVEPWAKFAENLYRNPAPYARDELYLWLEASDLPITPDGHFLAYKRVRYNYTDVHSGKFDNSIGRTPSMKREDVDSDRSRTCSAGLHFCSKSYLPNFGGTRVMIVKVNPEHVVSIPNDYSNAKGRACQYTVVGEISESEINEKVWPAISDEYEDDPWNVERFTLADFIDNVDHYGSIKKWAKAIGVPKAVLKARRLEVLGY